MCDEAPAPLDTNRRIGGLELVSLQVRSLNPPNPSPNPLTRPAFQLYFRNNGTTPVASQGLGSRYPRS